MSLYDQLFYDEKYSEKESYYEKMALKFFSRAGNSQTALNFAMTILRWSFYNSRQWIIQEDVDTFLNDEDQDTRNRVAFTLNIIKPLVRFLEGNAIRTDFSFSSYNLSPSSTWRKAKAMAEMKYHEGIAQKYPNLAEGVRVATGYSADPVENQQKFDRFYIDTFKEALDILLENIAEQNDFEEKKVLLATSLAIDGVGIIKDEERNGRMEFRRVFLNNFMWDTSAVEPDLSDATFMGEWYSMSVSEILERYTSLSPSKVAALKRLKLDSVDLDINNEISSHNIRYIASNGKVPVFEFYWYDNIEKKSAVVMDEFGQEVFEYIDCEESPYTSDDVIAEPESESLQRVIAGSSNGIVKTYSECIMYCIFVSPDVVTASEKDKTSSMAKTIILESGVLKGSLDGLSKRLDMMPYSVYGLNYYDGIFHSLVDDLISPQRLVNRFLSLGESTSNNWRPPTTFIDNDSIDGGKDELLEIQQKINKGKVVGVNANGQVNNIVGHVGSNFGESSGAMFEMANLIKSFVSSNEGINESMTGTVGGYRVNSQAIMSNIQQGTLMQESFFFALNKILQRCYDKMSVRGKSIYIDNETELTKLVGDNHADVFKLTKEFYHEDVRVYVKRSESKAQRIVAGTKLATELYSGQLITADMFASYINSATVEEVVKGFYDYQAKLAQAQAKAADVQKAAAPEILAAEQAAVESDIANQDVNTAINQSQAQEDNNIELMKTMLSKNVPQ